MKILWIKNSKVIDIKYEDVIYSSENDDVDTITTDDFDLFNIGDEWTIEIAIEKSKDLPTPLGD